MHTVIELTTCGAKGKDGPKSDECAELYNKSEPTHSVRILDEAPFKGMQVWKVPNENYYT